MYNIKELLEHRKKLYLFLVLMGITLASLAATLLPSMNYRTGENMSMREEFLVPVVHVVLYSIMILIIIGIIFLLGVVTKKVYVVKMLDESIKGIRKGRYMNANTVPRREELVQSHYAEKIKESGLKTFKMFDGLSQVERDEITGFTIDEGKKIP